MIAGIRKARDTLAVKCCVHLSWVKKTRDDYAENKLDPPHHSKLYLNRQPFLSTIFPLFNGFRIDRQNLN